MANKNFIVSNGLEVNGPILSQANDVVASNTDGSLDLSIAKIWRITLSANTTIFLSNVTEGQTIYLDILNGDTYTVTWPTDFVWTTGSAPILKNKHTISAVRISSTEWRVADMGGRA